MEAGFSASQRNGFDRFESQRQKGETRHGSSKSLSQAQAEQTRTAPPLDAGQRIPGATVAL